MPHRLRQGALRASPFNLLRRRRRHRHAQRATLRARTAPLRSVTSLPVFPTSYRRQSGLMVSQVALSAGMAPAQRQSTAAPPNATPRACLPQPAPSPAEATPRIMEARGDQPMLPGLGLEGAPLPRPDQPAADPRAELAAYPDIPAPALCRHAKRLGKAAELLVDSLLTRLGERVFPVDEHEPFDRILWLFGRPLRVTA